MKKNLVPIWSSITEVIAAQVSPDTFRRWFQAVELLDADEMELALGVPNNIYQLWIESNYMALVHSAIESILGAPRVVKFRISEVPAEEKKAPTSAPAFTSVEETSGTRGVSISYEQPLAHSHAETAPSVSPTAANNGMNPRNTFESFVVGKNNEFAHAAAQSVAKSPAQKYNPLFLHGGVGLGKTHLMQAIGQAVAARGKNTKVMYLSSERFTNEFIEAIQNNSLVKFRNRYRKADVLLIDDIQFFAGKGQTQEEFFHTFNTLADGCKQIVLSSDRPPAEIANLEARLVSRCEQGMTAEIQPPDIETRTAILRKKAEALSIRLEPEVFDFLAARVRTNVRRLEGALMRVAAFASMDGREVLRREDIEDVLKDILHEEGRRSVTIDAIQKKVAEHFDVRLADMTSKRRPQNIAFPRQIAMYLARELTKNSLNEIGQAFGGRDHGTVIHAHRLVQERMQAEEKIRAAVSFLDSQLSRL